MHFIRQGIVLKPISDISMIEHNLKPGYYRVAFDEEMGYSLIEVEPLTLPARLYGNVAARADRVFTTYMSRDVSTGVLLLGEKGGGKTMLARKICILAVARGQAVLICDAGSNVASAGFAHFLGALTFPFVALFDEFEKNFDEVKEQASLLSLMDGLSQSRKLFLLTSNDRSQISPFMLDRPGRIFYAFRYDGLERDVIIEYCADHAVSEADTDAIISAAEMSNTMSFDVLQAIVEEMKRYNLPFSEAVQGLNVGMDTKRASWDVLFRIRGEVMVPTSRVITHQMGKENHEYIRGTGAIQSLKGDAANAKFLKDLYKAHGDSDNDINFTLDAATEKGWDRKAQVFVFSTPYEGLEICLRRRADKESSSFAYA